MRWRILKRLYHFTSLLFDGKVFISTEYEVECFNAVYNSQHSSLRKLRSDKRSCLVFSGLASSLKSFPSELFRLCADNINTASLSSL